MEGTTATSSEASALADVRVLDVSTTTAGALAARLLGDFGADVVRLEREPAEALHTPLALAVHRNKRLVRLEGGTSGRQLVDGALPAADVLVVDRPAAELAAAGLDAPTLQRRFPALIHAWLPPHTVQGPMSDLPADDLLLSAWTGMADQQPGSEDHPTPLVVPILAYEQGALGATAILASLVARASTGYGRNVTVSGLHAVAAMNSTIMVDLPGVIRPFGNQGARSYGPPQFQMYECRDGQWLFLAALSPAFFFAALETIDLMELMVAPGVDGEFMNLYVPAVQETVGRAIAARIRERDRADWLARFDAARVPTAPVQSREEWCASETVRANGLLTSGKHAELGDVEMPGLGVVLSSTPGAVRCLPDSAAWIAPDDVWRDEARPVGGAPRPPAGEPPLAGLRVLDLTTYLAGPLAAQLLLSYGAEVIKVEPPTGDPYRLVAAASYSAMNRAKWQVTLDLHEDAGRQQFAHLVRGADVVVENLGSRANRFGVGYEPEASINPGIVHCAIHAWGAGPLADAPAFDPLIQARSGLMVAQGGDGPPVLLATAVHDVGTGTMAALGILVALYARTRSGRGQEVRTSLAASSTTYQAVECTRYAGSPPPPQGAEGYLGPAPSHRLYRCRDRWVALLGTPEAFTAFVDEQAPGRSPGTAPELVVEELCAARSAGEMCARLQAHGISAVEVLGRTEIFASPELARHGFFFQVEDCDFGPITVVRAFADIEGAAPPSAPRTRCHGEDNERFLAGAT